MASTSSATNLLLRVITLALLLVSLIVLASNTVTINKDTEDESKVRSTDVYAYRYTLATIIIGMAYTLLQTAFAIYHVSTGKRLLSNDGLALFDFYGDKVMSFLLATGTGAAFGVTKDLKLGYSGTPGANKFFSKANVSASFLLLGFLCSGVSSVLSSLALPKRE